MDAAQPVHLEDVTLAHAWLRLLRLRGIEVLFGTPGTEFVAVIEALLELDGEAAPAPLMVAHEFTAVAMACGYYLMTGRPQAVLVHVTVGAANAVGALMDALHLHIPLLFCAGRTPISERDLPGHRDKFIHWPQEWYDQGGMLRETVKWDYELREGATLEAVVDRALAISTTPPAGPVYLILPRERLVQRLAEITLQAVPAQPAALPAGPAPAALAALRTALTHAQRPLVLVNRLGIDPASVPLLVQVATAWTLAVATPNAHALCFPTDDAHFAGHHAAPWLQQADVVLILDVDVPWHPVDRGPHPQAQVFAVGCDPLHTRIPMRSHAASTVITASPRLLLEVLLEAPPALPDALRSARRTWLEEGRSHQLAALRERLARAASERPVSQLWVAHCLAEVWDSDLVLINELSLPPEPLRLTEPGSYFRASSASCLGWAGGAGLGARKACPEKVPVVVVGDGAWLFGNPAVVHHASLAHQLPIVIIVLNNAGMHSIGQAARQHNPQGRCQSAATLPFTSLEPSLDFASIARACGGYGESVEDPSLLTDALRRALAVARTEQRQALIDVRCS